jgi:hypothetical protein
MTESKILEFGGHKLWRLDSNDLNSAIRAIEGGEVAGVAISPTFGYKFNDLRCLGDLPKFQVLVTVYPENLDVSFVEQMPYLTYLSIGEGQKVPCDLNALVELQHLRITLLVG